MMYNKASKFLRAAETCIAQGETMTAIDLLSHVREMARQGKTQGARVIATQCTVAIQALLPEALDQALSAPDVTFPMLLEPISLEGML